MRPCCWLLDEHGILKLADFRRTRRLPKTSLGDMPIRARGIPGYMAPELFEAGGCHSYASDLWALGCLLFQMRRGHVPCKYPGPEEEDDEAADETLDETQLRAYVYQLQTLNIASNASGSELSSELADLIGWLLAALLPDRCGWESLAQHPFWYSANRGSSSNGNHLDIKPLQIKASDFPQHLLAESLAAEQVKLRAEQHYASRLAMAQENQRIPIGVQSSPVIAAAFQIPSNSSVNSTPAVSHQKNSKSEDGVHEPIESVANIGGAVLGVRANTAVESLVINYFKGRYVTSRPDDVGVETLLLHSAVDLQVSIFLLYSFLLFPIINLM